MRAPSRKSLLLLTALLGCLLRAAPAHAAPCAVPAGSAPALAAHDGGARLRFVRESMAHTAVMERRFMLGWGLTYGALAVGSPLALVLDDSREARVEAAWSSATSAFAALTAIIQPLLVMRDHWRLERLLTAPRRTGDGCAVLAEAERLLAHAARSEASARSPLAHVGSLIFNLGLGLALGYGLDRPATAARNTAIGIALGELMIFSRPTQAVRSLESYRRGDLTRPRQGGAFSFDIGVTAGAGMYGATLMGTF